MSYEEQQLQEIEALSAIYPEDELEIISNEYPNIAVRVNLKSNQEEDATAHDFELSLLLELGGNYPDELPEVSVEGLDGIFPDERIEEISNKLDAEAENYKGMVMVFSIVSAMQEEIGMLIEDLHKKAEQDADKAKQEVEAISRKKFEGTQVTPESFRSWKEKFDLERRALVEKQEKDREAALAGKSTGRDLFLKDATLNLSDVALIEQSVEIDETLFDDEDLDGLDSDGSGSD
ncbi:unnamed protein product [Auanema sp. JU1783]|nr:unnamed protein product [Auanema sp. JU1783]